jgi:TolB-like protein/class 3 adenylate cyclase/Flp pilus assembly protein TadD
MDKEPRRRILAILAADAVGYTRLMAADDLGTLAALDHARAVFARHCAEHGGRIVDNAGDSVLAAFETAAAAVRAALAVQQELATQAAAQPDDQQLRYRVGVHLGDTIEKDDGSIYGDGVNIASRLQALAPAGGVVVSQAALDLVAQRLQVPTKDLGEQQVKNYARPVRAYLLVPGQRAGMPARRRVAVGAALAVVAGGAGLAAWRLPWRRTADPAGPASTPMAAGRTASAPAMTQRLSLLVLPFQNIGGKDEDAYLADGLHEEVLNALARLPRLLVISRTTALALRGSKNSLREIAARLDVGHVVEGSLRRDGPRLRLTVQLVDAATDRHMLAVNYDRLVGKVLDLQSEVARQVAQALAGTLDSRELLRLGSVGTSDGKAYDLYLRARAVLKSRDPQSPAADLRSGLKLLDAALERDPNFVEALALKGETHVWLAFQEHQPADEQAARSALNRALSIDPASPPARLAQGLSLIYMERDPHGAVPQLERLVLEQPNAADAHAALALALRRAGKVAEASEHQMRALDLDPLNPYISPPIINLVGLRRWPEAVSYLERRMRLVPDAPPGAMILRGRILSRGQRDVAPLKQALQQYGARAPKVALPAEAELAFLEGRWADSIAAFEKMEQLTQLDRGLRIGIVRLAAGDPAAAAREWSAAATWARGNPPKNSVSQAALATVSSLLGRHDEALALIDKARAETPESRDAFNGPYLSFVRSVILVRAGRVAEGTAEIQRLTRVPFGAPADIFWPDPLRLLLKDDRRFDPLLIDPPRL